MFKKHSTRRSSSPIILLFRLILSLFMFGLLIIGIYGAYKHFSGFDPLKLDPEAIFNNLIKAKTPQQVIDVVSSIKISEKIAQFKGQKPDQVKKEQPLLENKIQSNSKIVFKFLVFADSHSDNNNLRKTLDQAKTKYPDIQFIVGLGDYTEVGTIDELKNAKSELDLSGLRYFLIPGDHDLWDSRDKGSVPNNNFRQVFGPTYQSFSYGNFRLILLNNSDNYLGVDDDQLNWLDLEIEKAKTDKANIVIFVHEPLYHPSSDHVMGRVESKLKSQAKSLIFKLKETGVKRVFAGDIHYFSEYEEPETKLLMTTIGAVTIERNPQAPRYAIVHVFEDGQIGVEDVEIK